MPSKIRRNTPAVFLGNLRTDVKISFLKDSIIALFALINIDHVRKRHISVVCRPHATFSFVSVPTNEDADNAAAMIRLLISSNSISERLWDRLVEQGLYLKVGTSASFTDKLNETEHSGFNDPSYFNSDGDSLEPKSSDSNQFNAQQTQENSSLGQSRASLHSTNPSHRQNKVPIKLVQQQMVAGSAFSDSSLLPKTTKPGTTQKPQVKRYVLHQKLGNETRNVEYKCGQGSYKDKHFFRHVSVYMSAFLNSEGGTLLIGVDDNGIVQGLGLSHKEEDSLRTKIDITIKDMRPEVFPSSYSVHFVPVFDGIGKMLKELKVIEISIKRGESSQLYQTGKGEVYIRRDGSVQELSASAIQEYTRIRVLQELEKKGHEMKNLEQQDADLKNQLSILQQHLSDIRIQMSEAENHRLQSLQVEKEKNQLQEEVTRLGRELHSLQGEKRAEQQKQAKLEQELEELRREKKAWQEKSLRKNRSKTCIIA